MRGEVMATFKDSSKQSWTSAGSVEHINAGSLQRIADAAEAMAKNHVQLQSELDRYKRHYEEQRDARYHAERRINSLKGVITRLKKARK